MSLEHGRLFDGDRFYRVRDIARTLGISVPTVWRWAKLRQAEGFPELTALGPGVTGATGHQLNAFHEAMQEGRNDAA